MRPRSDAVRAVAPRRLVGAVAVLLCTPFVMALGPVETEIHRVDGTTTFEGTSTASFDVPYASFLQMMCNYDLMGELEEGDVVELQVAVTEALSAMLLTDPPDELEEVRALALEHRVAPACPTGESQVVGLMDFPWPVPDAWQLSRFSASVSDHLLIRYDFLAGTANESSGSWTVREAQDGKALLSTSFRIDMGFRIPEFIVSWAVGSTFPRLFAAMEHMVATTTPAASESSPRE